MFLTFWDCITHGVDYLGGNALAQVARDINRAITESHREISTAHNWTYLYKHGRYSTNAPYGSMVDGSTIAWPQTPNQVTLTGGTWPSWAPSSYIMVGLLKYRVASLLNSTTVTLDAEVQPNEPIVAGTDYTLYQDTYLLPDDFLAQDQSLYELNFGGMTYVHPRDWLYENRYVFTEGIPQAYTITGDPYYPGKLVTRIMPFPTAQATIDFIYKRKLRGLNVSNISTGTASMSNAGNVLTCPAGPFLPSHVGTVVRVGGQVSSSQLPTNMIGANPAIYESFVTTYISPTQVTMNDAAPQAFSGVSYMISDPVDIEQSSMTNLFLRCIEKHLSTSRALPDKADALAAYAKELSRARAADTRSFAYRFVGPQNRIRQRFRDMPVGPDQP